ncbi:MAG: AMP-binding protein [Rhodospirillales bacterium]|nr:AMP-binding protein [Rhodospirillales bacterium]
MWQPGGVPSAHADQFVRSLLPPPELWPRMDYSTLPELRAYPDRLNAAVVLLDDMAAAGHRDRPVLHFDGVTWTYGELLARANRIARVLVEEFGLIPGERVLLRSMNTPMLVACWFAVLKAGGIVVATMPLLRAKELGFMLERARIRHALCEASLAEEMELAKARTPGLENLLYFSKGGDGGAGLDRAMAGKPADFANVATAADDVALVAFTSGTTGNPKATVHFHRDCLASADCFPRYVAVTRPDDVFVGSPPLAFTFGLGMQTLFPMRFGASTVLVEKPTPEALLEAIQRYRATVLATAPTAYRTMTDMVGGYDISSLRMCVSAGEHLPKPTSDGWHTATGIRIIDGIGATEMMHIFISASGPDIRPGSTGKAIPGYQARVLDDDGNPLPPGSQGRLAVIGPTGCRYMDDPERQRTYVQDGWNLTGDIYEQDADGYFWYVARGDDMIISAGYNISGPEVESVLLAHPKVRECAVVASPDPARGNIVKAFVVLHDRAEATAGTVKELQDFVKAEVAPYKYPRAVEFVDDLPKTQTGKLQRFVLRRQEREKAGGK